MKSEKEQGYQESEPVKGGELGKILQGSTTESKGPLLLTEPFLHGAVRLVCPYTMVA